jgi:hypothetical protein
MTIPERGQRLDHPGAATVPPPATTAPPAPAPRAAFEVIATATVLKSGDRVLLTADDHVVLSDADRLMDTLGERFPGVHFTLVSGVTATVAPAEAVSDAG